MARKSRKNKNIDRIAQVEEKLEFTSKIPTAIYARLSEENNGYDSDDSIQTQIKLVESYVESKPELQLLEIFVDNGYTGTNFERPEFIRMMESVKSGEIRCIVVKDLSRFGRDYLETGYYIETIFPLLDVRLISVTDDFDTSRQSDRDSLTIPIKNMVNAMYAKDVSRKQIAAGDLKRKMGIFDATTCPYGYTFSKKSRKYVIVPELSPYVRMIFSWAVAGVKRSEIAKRLDLVGAQTPSQILHEQGVKPAVLKTEWNTDMVKRILSNPVYAGIIAMGKSRQSLYQGIADENIKREDWVYIYDAHDAIVSRYDYQKIDDEIKRNREEKQNKIALNEQKRSGFDDCFQGLVYCGECGKPMPFARGTHSHNGNSEITFMYYRCIARKKTSKCKNQRIQQNFLKIVVMDQIKNLIRNLCNRKEFLQRIKRDEVSNNTLRLMRRNITSMKKKRNLLEDKISSLYADFAEGVLDEEEYQLIKERTIMERQQMDVRIGETEQKLLETEKAINNYIRRVQKLESFLDSMEFNEEIVKELVHDIQIYDGNRIEIKFNCTDLIENNILLDCIREVKKDDSIVS